MGMFQLPWAMAALDAACRLGPRPVALAAWHRAPPARAMARRRLRAADPARPEAAGPGLAGGERAPAPPPRLPAAHAEAVRLAAAALAGRRIDWHGPFPPHADALTLDLFGPGDVRPVWERNRWAELPLLAQAARLDPSAGHAARAAALLGEWDAANPAFRGPNWACGQEAGLRLLHLGLALALLGATPDDAARRLVARHARRIAATPAYAAAQDNNHPVSEAAGLLVAGLLLDDRALAGRGAARLDAALRRLVAPDGAFAQPSTGYHRLLLDVVAIAVWLSARAGGPLPGAAAMARAAAATRWLARLACPETGALPRIGHQDGSAFADLSRRGPEDARGSLERAARLLAGGGSAGFAEDPGCAWLALPPPAAAPWPAEARWRSEGFAGWRAGAARAVLRTAAPLRFRPGQADLLHLELWDGPVSLLRDGGTGAYNPPPEQAWWHAHFTGTAAHNTITFDGADQMPRVGRFLFARWPRGGTLPDGAWIRDHRGRRHARTVRPDPDGRGWTVEDVVEGRFEEAALRWRLDPDQGWRPAEEGPGLVVGRAGRLAVSADHPVAVTLEPGWESPFYGVVHPAPVLVARLRGGSGRVTRARLVTRILLAVRCEATHPIAELGAEMALHSSPG